MKGKVCIIQNGKPKWIEFDFNNIDKIKEIIPEGLEKITISVVDTKHKYQINWEALRKLNIPYIKIQYGANLNEALLLENFIEYKNHLIEIKNQIIKPQMSPYEKLLAVYKYAISFPYISYVGMGCADNFISKESQGRLCEDYCSFIKEILMEDENIYLSTVSIACISPQGVGDHAELIVRIDDDKYDIHGVYMSDPTNDTYVESWKEDFGEDYSPGEIFERFLMPLSSDRVYDYGEQLRFTWAFPFDIAYQLSKKKDANILLTQTKEDILRLLTANQEELIEDYEEFFEEVDTVISSLEQSQKERYIYAQEIDFKKTIQALVTIMHLQGKSKEEIGVSINRIIHNNNYIHKTNIEEQEIGRMI